MKLLYVIALLLAEQTGKISEWLWQLVEHWTTQPLGFAVVPLLILAWAPARKLFEGLVFVLVRIIPRIPIEERAALWPNR